MIREVQSETGSNPRPLSKDLVGDIIKDIIFVGENKILVYNLYLYIVEGVRW